VRRIMFFRIGGKNLHLPKLIGAFLVVASLLMFFNAGALMFESWDNVKFLNKCLQDPNAFPQGFCQQSAYYAGVFVRPDQDSLGVKQTWSLLLEPIASLFLWLIGLLVGAMLYLSGKIILPIEEAERIISERPLRRKKKR